MHRVLSVPGVQCRDSAIPRMTPRSSGSVRSRPCRRLSRASPSSSLGTIRLFPVVKRRLLYLSLFLFVNGFCFLNSTHAWDHGVCFDLTDWRCSELCCSLAFIGGSRIFSVRPAVRRHVGSSTDGLSYITLQGTSALASLWPVSKHFTPPKSSNPYSVWRVLFLLCI